MYRCHEDMQVKITSHLTFLLSNTSLSYVSFVWVPIVKIFIFLVFVEATNAQDSGGGDGGKISFSDM